MIMVNYNDIDTGLIRLELVKYDEESINKAKQKFIEYKEKKVILTANFESMKWTMYSGHTKFRLDFNFDEIMLNKEYKNRQFYTYIQFVNSVKSYVLFRLSDRTIDSIQMFIKKLKYVIESTHYFNLDYIDNWLDKINISKVNPTNTTFIRMIADFTNYIDIPGINIYRERIELDIISLSELNKSMRNSRELNRRKLADFQSVFLFDKSINKFWNNIATKDEKELYFPIYLWWRITNILPLRVTEFIVTPYECIEKRDDGIYTITIRRSTLKGRKLNSNKLSHSIDKDYKCYTYPITNEIAKLIEDYRDITEKYRYVDSKEQLFSSTKYVVDSFGNGMFINKGLHITTDSLRRLINKFYVNILQNKMGIVIKLRNEQGYINEVEDDFLPLKYNEILPISPGDTRHYALINMILNDFNPVLVKDFAGHMDINTSYHYFGNLSEMVKCMSYTKYKELCEYDLDTVIIENRANITGNKIINAMNSSKISTVDVDYGKCSSKNFKKGNLLDCTYSGFECEDCDYFTRTIKESIEERDIKIKILENEIKKEGELLGLILNSYKDDIRGNLELQKSILRLQHKSALYMDHIKLEGKIYEQN